MGQLQPGSNNVIAYSGSAPSTAYFYKIFNQYKFKSGTGYVDLTTITHWKRSKKNGPVSVNKVEVKYTNTSNGNPYLSEFFIDKRNGSATKYPTIPKAHKILKSSGSFSINLSENNVQSVQLYVHADIVGSAAGQGTRYQYITMFW